MSNPTWGNATRDELRPDPDAPNRFMSLAEALEARHTAERHGTAFWVCRDAICLIFNENYAAYCYVSAGGSAMPGEGGAR